MYSKKRENEIGVPKMTKIDQIAQAFAQGVKFAENLKLAMDAAKDGEEDGHWVTLGEGEEARRVFIKDKKKAAKTESKKAESKKAESKPAQQRTESWREMAARINREQAARANRSQEEKDKATMLSHQLNMQLFSYYDSVREATEDIERSAAEQLQLLDKSGNRAKNDLLMSALHGIDSAARTSQMFLRDYYRRVVAAAEKGKIDSTRADKELDAFKKLAGEIQSLTSSMKAQISHIDDPRYNKRGDRAKIANEMRRLAKKAEEDVHNNIRDRVQDLIK
jgi:hypothetical protein